MCGHFIKTLTFIGITVNRKTDYWLLYVKDEGEPITLSQELRTHFEKFEELLTKGKENFLKNEIAAGFVRKWLRNGNYFVLFNPKEEEYFTGPKIVAPYRSRENVFSYNETDWVCITRCMFHFGKSPGVQSKIRVGFAEFQAVLSLALP